MGGLWHGNLLMYSQFLINRNGGYTTLHWRMRELKVGGNQVVPVAGICREKNKGRR